MNYYSDEITDATVNALEIGNEMRFINDPRGTNYKPNTRFRVNNITFYHTHILIDYLFEYNATYVYTSY